MLDFWTVRSKQSPIRGVVVVVFGPTVRTIGCSDTHARSFDISHLAAQTKNVAGRLLVGLRWWNEVTDEGSNWRFETLEEVRGTLWASMCLENVMLLGSDQTCCQMCPVFEHGLSRYDGTVQGQRAINGKDSACFWWTLYVIVSAYAQHPIIQSPLICLVLALEKILSNDVKVVAWKRVCVVKADA